MCTCEYLLIGGSVSRVSLFLVPQNSLCVEVESFQLLNQVALLRCMLCAPSVQRLHFRKITTTQALALHVMQSHTVHNNNVLLTLNIVDLVIFFYITITTYSR